MSRLNTIAKRLAVGALVTACSLGVFAETSPITPQQKKNAETLIQKALNSDLGYSIVESLTTEIGPRLGGSEAEKRARELGVEVGKRLHIALTAPYAQPLYGTALGGAAPSESEINADIVYFRDIHALTAVKDGALNGKIAFIDGDAMVKSQTGAGYGQANQRRRSAVVLRR